ncbi:MAG: HPr kinase/phosphorylase [Alphaproteobacteria bacterium]
MARRAGTAERDPTRHAPTRHATCVALGPAGVLIRGPSGRGKSDLALRLIDGGARLVADDRVALARVGAAVAASAPDTLAGLLEVRGLGIVRLPRRRRALLGLVVDLVEGTVPRWPRTGTCSILGVRLRRIALDGRDASAPAKVRLALRLGRGHVLPRP